MPRGCSQPITGLLPDKPHSMQGVPRDRRRPRIGVQSTLSVMGQEEEGDEKNDDFHATIQNIKEV